VRHDYVVQSVNAFNETVRGILNLKSLDRRVEIRVVIHKQTIDRLVRLCEFIARNLLFVDHVALMGLEITGFTRANLDDLWIDPPN
jgi:MoaA/NifB/PqqE/SkfB family radical SAM enzyme